MKERIKGEKSGKHDKAEGRMHGGTEGRRDGSKDKYKTKNENSKLEN